jgi:hypothetical protein
MTRETTANNTNHVRGLLAQHRGEDFQPSGVEHPWIYQFVDIIYVGTIFNVSWLIENCGSSVGVFGVTFCYFAIMYSTRLAFDEYNCISPANGILHLLTFCVYGAGVFIMAASINADPNHDKEGHHDYGHCTRRATYDVGFACGFMTTRLALIVMYILYFRVFHESNRLENFADTVPATVGHDNIEEERSSEIASPLRHSSGASSLIEEGFRGMFGSDRNSVVERHFSTLVTLKIVPAVINLFVMCGMLVKGNPALFLPIVAGIEILFWFLSSWLIYDDEKWKQVTLERHFAMERLGLFFMLVLGEAMLHLCRMVDPDKQEHPRDQYIVLL